MTHSLLRHAWNVNLVTDLYSFVLFIFIHEEEEEKESKKIGDKEFSFPILMELNVLTYTQLHIGNYTPENQS